MPHARPRLFFIPALLLLVSCAAPNSPDARMDRVDANREVYESWPLAVKEAVLEGRVTRGMDPTMVHVAIGKPDERIEGNNGDVVWIYYQGNSYNVQQPVPVQQPRGIYPQIPSPTRDPFPVPRRGVMRGQMPPVQQEPIPQLPTVVRDTRYDVEIVFRDGLVVAGDGVR